MKAHANNAEAIGPEVIDTYLIAAALQQPHRIRYYIEHLGLHPDTTRDGKPTALCYASLKPNIVLIDYYLEKGANVNHADAIGMTPLHYAAMGGCVVCLARLVSEGAELNRRNRSGETPLASAVSRARSTQCIELLKRYGALTGEGAGSVSPAASPCFH